MEIDPTLPLPLTLHVHAGAPVVLLTRDLASAGMPIQIAAAVNLIAEVLPCLAPAEAPGIGGFPVVELKIIADQPGPGSVDITWARPWEAADPLKGFAHRIEIQAHPPTAELHPIANQVAEQISQAPAPSKQEVSAFLDVVDGQRPYGARKSSVVQGILDSVGRSLAMAQVLACTRHIPLQQVEDIVPDPAMQLLVHAGFDRHRAAIALSGFMAARQQSAGNAINPAI